MACWSVDRLDPDPKYNERVFIALAARPLAKWTKINEQAVDCSYRNSSFFNKFGKTIGFWRYSPIIWLIVGVCRSSWGISRSFLSCSRRSALCILSGPPQQYACTFGCSAAELSTARCSWAVLSSSEPTHRPRYSSSLSSSPFRVPDRYLWLCDFDPGPPVPEVEREPFLYLFHHARCGRTRPPYRIRLRSRRRGKAAWIRPIWSRCRWKTP